ncbi:MAG: hypothetical protein LDLANPLL_01974 [Turneriella sp.]|nr:hypothetical protein [Turneriella sp.]
MDKTFSSTTLKSKAVRLFFPEVCLECRKKIADKNLFCEACLREKPLSWHPTFVKENEFSRRFLLSYEGVGKTLFKAAKFSERSRARKFLIAHAKEEFNSLLTPSTCVLALPSRRSFLRKLLKKCIPRKQLVLDAFFMREKLFKPSANKALSAAQRHARIHGSLFLNTKHIPMAEKYLLCDDVFTSGATLERAGYLVKENLGVKSSQITLWALMYRPHESERLANF